MRKFIGVVSILFILTSCGNSYNESSCVFEENDVKRVLDIVSNDDNELISFELTNTYTVDEAFLNAKSDDVEKLLMSNLPKDEIGIKTEVKYDKKSKKATQTTKVSLDDLQEHNYDRFGIPMNKSVVKFTNSQKLAGYTCTK